MTVGQLAALERTIARGVCWGLLRFFAFLVVAFVVFWFCLNGGALFKSVVVNHEEPPIKIELGKPPNK